MKQTVLTEEEIVMKKYCYDTLGVMIDVSRNAVMNIDSFKKYIIYLEKMGYNCVWLYSEDTYEVEGEPFFGYLRGRYTRAELRELDDFAFEHGIELIPCIQTLAHLRSYIRWHKVNVDYDDVLLADDERTYAFIDNLIKALSSTFRTRKIHVGMDEAWSVGRGNHLKIHGYEPRPDIMKRHLERVNAIVKKYGCSAIIWSDMFICTWSGGTYTALGEKGTFQVPKNVVDSVPEDVELVYWDYYYETKQHYENNIKTHKHFNSKLWFAGGVWSWRSYVPNNHYSISSMIPALDACREAKIKNIVMTIWGDNGCEASRYSTLPALLYIAEYARGNKDEEKIKAKFKRIFGADYDSFMELDDADNIHYSYDGHERASRKVLFTDLFSGFLDTAVKEGYSAELARLAESYRISAKKYRKWAYLFNSHAALCDVMAVKYELGVKTRRAYQSGDKEELLRLANEDYSILIKRLRAFRLALQKQWFTENKPQGFDVQELRVGGVAIRAESCQSRLLDYVKGKLTEIPELAEQLIEIKHTDNLYKPADYDYLSTVSTLWGNE